MLSMKMEQEKRAPSIPVSELRTFHTYSRASDGTKYTANTLIVHTFMLNVCFSLLGRLATCYSLDICYVFGCKRSRKELKDKQNENC